MASHPAAAKKVFVIGWEGAQPATLERLRSSGRLVHFSALIKQGATVPLVAPPPSFPQAEWTTLATGRRPHEHGVLCPPQPTSICSSLRSISRELRGAPAIWNLLQQAGLRTHVLGWPITQPAENLNGVCVSDQFFDATRLLTGSSITPAELIPVLRGLRVSPAQVAEITLSQMFCPERSDLPPNLEPQLESACRSLIANSATLFRILDWCLKERVWEFTACVFSGLRQGHDLAAWLQRMAPAATATRERLLAGCYEHHDLLLGQLLLRLNDDTLVIAVSASTANHRTREFPASSRLAAAGVIGGGCGQAVLQGPGVSSGVLTGPRSALDLAPTILAALAVPIDSSLPGKPWQDLFASQLMPIAYSVPGREPTAVPEEQHAFDPAGQDSAGDMASDPAVAHLIELGYRDPDTTAAQEELANYTRTAELHRAWSLWDAGQTATAIRRLEDLVAEFPRWSRPHFLLAEIFFFNDNLKAARAELDWLTWEGVESTGFYKLCGALDLAQRRLEDAEENLCCARRNGALLPGAASLEGEVFLRRQDLTAAENAFRQSLVIDGPAPSTLAGLATCCRWANRPEEAALAALDALAIDPRFARAHYELAAALVKLGRLQAAQQALETWIALDPLAGTPLRVLSRWAQPERAAELRAQARAVFRRRRLLRPTALAEDATTTSS